MIKELIKLSNHLDEKGFVREANYLDALLKKASDEDDLVNHGYKMYSEMVGSGAIYVSLYEVERAYGGPEEGGWWYDAVTLDSYKKFEDADEADRFANWLREQIQREVGEGSRAGGPLHSSRGFEKLPDPELSGLPEDYIPLGFSGSAREWSVVTEKEPGQNATRGRPRYE